MVTKAYKVAEKVSELLEQKLCKNLIGVYLQSSLAMGCFNPESSDIDFLAVVKNELPNKTKKSLGDSMVEISDKNNQKIELSILLMSKLKNFQYPTPYEFHFSPENKKDCEKGTIELKGKKTDHDLAAHIVITRKYGKVLFGKPIKEVFPKVKYEYFLDSVAEDSQQSYRNIIYGPSTGTCGVPPYAVLNFCRVLAFIQDNKVTSKKTGATWALHNLPEKFSPIIQAAADEYKKKGSSEKVDCALLKNFAQYAQKKIDNANNLETT